MSVRIGHASLGSNGKISGDSVGDNNGKEVCIRKWYNKPWSCVIRFKSRSLAEKAVANCITLCNGNKVGYDQSQRNTLRAALKECNWDCSKIYKLCETDCSAFMSVIAESVGVPIPYFGSNAPTTSTMVAAFQKTGYFDVLYDAKYLLTDEYLMKGDILVKPGSHTVMVLDDGVKVGNIVTPAFKPTSMEDYKVGMTYTLQANMFVRLTANGEKKKYSEFSANAKQNGYADSDGSGILRKDARVTCQGLKIDGGKLWMKIPLGWVCAINEKGKVYIL